METYEVSFLTSNAPLKGCMHLDNYHLRMWLTVHVPVSVPQNRFDQTTYLELTFGYFVLGFDREEFTQRLEGNGYINTP